MLSVLKHTHNPVKFWFLKNYLSPIFKVLLMGREGREKGVKGGRGGTGGSREGGRGQREVHGRVDIVQLLLFYSSYPLSFLSSSGFHSTHGAGVQV